MSAQEDLSPGRSTRQEQALVKAVHTSATSIRRSLERLRGFYIRSKNVEMQYWVEQELSQYHMMVKDPYLLKFDLPSKDLKPNQNIAEANKILADALRPFLRPDAHRNRQDYHRAELLLRRLINDYRQSDKLDDACFYLGEIYSANISSSTGLGRLLLNIVWYDPATNYPAV